MARRQRLDEPSSRRPCWVEGAWIELADGQAWSFPRPRARLLVGPGPELLWSLEGRPDPAFGATIDALTAADAGLDADAGLACWIKLAALLLTTNYDLGEAELARLLGEGYRGDPRGLLAVHKAIHLAVLKPAFEDVNRARRGLPPLAPGGGALVGLN